VHVGSVPTYGDFKGVVMEKWLEAFAASVMITGIGTMLFSVVSVLIENKMWWILPILGGFGILMYVCKRYDLWGRIMTW
jgi:hypothetical protein